MAFTSRFPGGCRLRCGDRGCGLPGSSADESLPSFSLCLFAEQQFLENVYLGKIEQLFFLPSLPGIGLAGVSSLDPLSLIPSVSGLFMASLSAQFATSPQLSPCSSPLAEVLWGGMARACWDSAGSAHSP